MRKTEVKSYLLLLALCLAILRLVDSSPHGRRAAHDCDSGHPADVIFILDASNSIWRPDFQRQIGFVTEISRMFRVGPSNVQIAVITYADYPQFQFHLNDYTAKSDVLTAIESVRQMGGYHTSTPDALRYMRERGFGESSGGRANVTRVGIVITDGRSDDPVKTAAEARRAKDAGIHLFAVGVGLELDLQELEEIASFPSRYYTFMVESYSGLENIKDLLAIKACTVTDPPTTTTTTVTTTQSTTTTTQLNEEDSSHRLGRHRKPDETEGLENNGDTLHGRRRKDGTQESLDGEESTSSNGKRGKNDRTGHEDEFGGEQTAERRRKGTAKEKSKTESETESETENETENESVHSATKIPQINFAAGPSTTTFDADYYMEYDETSQQWRRKLRKWTDVRQDGSWGYDKDGERIWIPDSKEIPTHVSTGGEELGRDGRGNKTQESTGFGSPDYPVLPVDEHHRRDHSKTNHSNRKTDSKAKNLTAPKKLTVCRPKTPLDVVFVVDSKSGDRRGQRQMLEAVRHIVEQVDMDDGQMRVQFVHSCSGTDNRLRIANNRSPIAKSLPVDEFVEVRSTALSQTSDLFETMTSKLTANGKPGRKRVGVYLTNGQSGDLEKALEAVQAAKDVHDVEMFTVGLGKAVNPVELRAIASCDVAKHMFTLRHQHHHSKSKEILKHLARSLCSVR